MKVIYRKKPASFIELESRRVITVDNQPVIWKRWDFLVTTEEKQRFIVKKDNFAKLKEANKK